MYASPPLSRARTYRVGCVIGLNTLPLEQEPDRVHSFALALAKSRHEFVEFGTALNFEEDLIIVIGNFDVQMLAINGRLRRRTLAAVFIRHCSSIVYLLILSVLLREL